jgi:hypothetical protein
MRKKLSSHKRGKISLYKGKYSHEKKIPLFISISAWHLLNIRTPEITRLVIKRQNLVRLSIETLYFLTETPWEGLGTMGPRFLFEAREVMRGAGERGIK